MFGFIKRKSQKKAVDRQSVVRQQSVKEKIDSSNRSMYASSYDIVRRYNATMAQFLALENVAKFAVDWLADSIQRGVQVEPAIVSRSVERELPYLCVTEEELWLFEKEENPMQDSVEGIFSAILKYSFGATADKNKLNFWINHLFSLAEGGNMMAQAMICWKCGMITEEGKYSGVIPKEQWDKYREEYLTNVVNTANNGDAQAKLAVAVYCNKIDDAKKELLYKSAIQKGLSDACYYYVKFLDMKRFEANGYVAVDVPPYGTAQWQEYMRDELALYKKGAELNNGIMAGYCQFRLAEMYANGDGGVLRDGATAQIWYRKAYENGYEQAKPYIG